MHSIVIKLKKKLNWKPQIKFDNGLKETFLWYLNNKKYYSSLTKRDIIKRLGLKKWLQKESY